MLKQSTLNLVATTLHAASLFLAVSLIARFCSPAALGDYVLAYAVSAPIYMFLKSRVRVVLANNVDPVDPTWNFVRFRIITSVSGWILIAIITLIFLSADQIAVVLIVSLFKAAEAVGDICGGALQRKQKLSDVQTAIILRALLTMIVLALLVPRTHSVIWAATAIASAWTLTCLALLVHLRKVNPPNKTCTTTFHITVSRFYRLGFIALLSSIAYNIPRYFLAALGDDSALGFYGAIAYIGMMLTMVAYAVSDATIPQLTYRFRDTLFSHAYLREVRLIYGALATFGVTAFALALLAGPTILSLAFSREYAAYSTPFAVMILVGTFNAFSICQEHTVVALQQTGPQLRAIALAFCLLLLTSALLIPTFGVWGAVLADLSYSVFYFLIVERIVVRSGNLRLVNG